LPKPAPEVLIQHTDHKTQKTLQVLEQDSVWAVTYKGYPFNLKQVNLIDNIPPPKYKKTTFQSKGHAEHLADRLNSRFGTSDFGVAMLITGDNE